MRAPGERNTLSRRAPSSSEFNLQSVRSALTVADRAVSSTTEEKTLWRHQRPIRLPSTITTPRPIMRPLLIITVKPRITTITGVTTSPKSIQPRLIAIVRRPTSIPAKPTSTRKDRSADAAVANAVSQLGAGTCGRRTTNRPPFPPNLASDFAKRPASGHKVCLTGAISRPNILGAYPEHFSRRRPRIGPMQHQRLCRPADTLCTPTSAARKMKIFGCVN